MDIEGTSGEEARWIAKYNDVAAAVGEKSSARGTKASDLGLQRQEEKSAELQRNRTDHSNNEQRDR